MSVSNEVALKQKLVFVEMLKADQLKILLATLVLLVMVKMLLDLLLTPDIMLAYKGGH